MLRKIEYDFGEAASYADASAPELIELCRSGGIYAERAMQEIYSRFTPRLLGVLEKHLSISAVAPEDIVQEAMLDLHVKMDRLSFRSENDVWKYLVSVSLNIVRNRVDFFTAGKRDIRNTQSLDDVMEGGKIACDRRHGGNAFSRRRTELAHDVLEVLEETNPEVAEFLRQRFLGRYTQEELAEIRGCTERTIRRALGRAFARARQIAEKADITDNPRSARRPDDPPRAERHARRSP